MAENRFRVKRIPFLGENAFGKTGEPALLIGAGVQETKTYQALFDSGGD
jgi:hypothetical protein